MSEEETDEVERNICHVWRGGWLSEEDQFISPGEIVVVDGCDDDSFGGDHDDDDDWGDYNYCGCRDDDDSDGSDDACDVSLQHFETYK